MASFKLRVIWGNDNSQRLTFSDGMPASLNVLSKKIENECGLQGQQFRLQYMDKDFNEFMNLTSVSDLADKDTVRVVFLPLAPVLPAICLMSSVPLPIVILLNPVMLIMRSHLLRLQMLTFSLPHQ